MFGPLVNLSKVCYEPVERAAILPRYFAPCQVEIVGKRATPEVNSRRKSKGICE